MKRVKVSWTEKEIVTYEYEDIIEVNDNEDVTCNMLIKIVSGSKSDPIYTNYKAIELQDGGIEIGEYEILPPLKPTNRLLEAINNIDTEIAKLSLKRDQMSKQLKSDLK